MASYTADQLQRLKDAYARGVLEIREGDTWLKYNSMAELRIAINDMEAAINNTAPRGTRRVIVSKGY